METKEAVSAVDTEKKHTRKHTHTHICQHPASPIDKNSNDNVSSYAKSLSKLQYIFISPHIPL